MNLGDLRFDGEFCGDYADSEADWNDERQPDEAQEWHDFDPDC